MEIKMPNQLKLNPWMKSVRICVLAVTGPPGGFFQQRVLDQSEQQKQQKMYVTCKLNHQI